MNVNTNNNNSLNTPKQPPQLNQHQSQNALGSARFTPFEQQVTSPTGGTQLKSKISTIEVNISLTFGLITIIGTDHESSERARVSEI